MPKKYIDADALRKKILNTRFAVCYDLPWNRWWIKKSIGVVNKILEIIKEFPSADVKEVKRGGWVEDFMVGEGVYRCTNCDEKFVTLEGTPYDNRLFYCPFCGAKMDGKENEDV